MSTLEKTVIVGLCVLTLCAVAGRSGYSQSSAPPEVDATPPPYAFPVDVPPSPKAKAKPPLKFDAVVSACVDAQGKVTEVSLNSKQIDLHCNANETERALPQHSPLLRDWQQVIMNQHETLQGFIVHSIEPPQR